MYNEKENECYQMFISDKYINQRLLGLIRTGIVIYLYLSEFSNKILNVCPKVLIILPFNTLENSVYNQFLNF